MSAKVSALHLGSWMSASAKCTWSPSFIPSVVINGTFVVRNEGE